MPHALPSNFELPQWAHSEAKKLLEHLNTNRTKPKQEIIFETGYGPSGLPHLGTFGEVARTVFVLKAFQEISDIKTRLIVFSDDLDALRKVPSNVPSQRMLHQHIGRSLCDIPDPYDEHESFAESNNIKLQNFINAFGFNYDFVSSKKMYRTGKFNEFLIKTLENYDEIKNSILPTVGKKRQQTYSPFLPIDEQGFMHFDSVISVNPSSRTILFNDSDGHTREASILDGCSKLQWKVDWGMRWAALGIDYEMSGKDLIESVKASKNVTSILGSPPPITLSYELFNDEHGRKISKSKGNGMSLEDIMRYYPDDILYMLMSENPKRPLKLCFNSLDSIFDKKSKQQALNFSPRKLQNTLSAIGLNDKDLILRYFDIMAKQQNKHVNPLTRQHLSQSITRYLERKKSDIPARIQPLSNFERNVLVDFSDRLREAGLSKSTIEKTVYEIGCKHFGKKSLRDWFTLLYQVVLGKDNGPRISTLIEIYGPIEFSEILKGCMNQLSTSKEQFNFHAAVITKNTQAPSTSPSISALKTDLFRLRPELSLYDSHETLGEYFGDLKAWNPNDDDFPLKNIYISLISSEACRIHGSAKGDLVKTSLERNFVINSGPHLGLPRNFDYSWEINGSPNTLNTLVFQSNIIYSAYAKEVGSPVAVNLHTGKTPLSYSLSGRYAQISNMCKIIPIAPSRYLSTPQINIPPLSITYIENIQRNALKTLTNANHRQKSLVGGMFERMKSHNAYFTDQICAAHDFIYDHILNQEMGAPMVTIESDRTDIALLVSALEDESSLTARIFNTPHMLELFRTKLSNIQTGWDNKGSTFAIVQKDRVIKDNADDRVGSQKLIEGIKEGMIYPRNALLHAVILMETGASSLGGMMQIAYGTQIKKAVAEFLEDIGDIRRSSAILKIPTEKSFLSSVFSFTQGLATRPFLTSYGDWLDNMNIYNGLTSRRIMEMSPKTSIAAAGEGLYRVLSGKSPDAKFFDELSLNIINSGGVIINKHPKLKARYT